MKTVSVTVIGSSLTVDGVGLGLEEEDTESVRHGLLDVGRVIEES